jgi:hypothetical protein
LAATRFGLTTLLSGVPKDDGIVADV